MNRTSRRSNASALALLIALVALVASVVACTSTNSTTAGPATTGSPTTAKSDKPDKTDTTERSDTTRNTRRATSTTDRESDPGGDDDTTTTSRRSSSTTDGGGSSSFTTITVQPTSGNEDFCERLATGFNNLSSNIKANNYSEADIIAAVTTLYKVLADNAPSEIKADFEALISVFEGSTSLADIASKAETPEIGQSAQRLETWLTTNCGINPQLPIS